MRKSTMSGLARWRKFRSSLVSVISTTPSVRKSFFEDTSTISEKSTENLRTRRMSARELANHIMNLLPMRETIENLTKRFDSSSFYLLARVLRPDALRAVSEVHHVRECLQRMISAPHDDTSHDLEDLHKDTIPSSWNVLMTRTSPRRWCEIMDEHISALMEICFDEKTTTDHALSLDNLSHPSRTMNLLSRVLLMKQDQDLIIQGTLKGKNGLLLRGQGQINEEESEEVVLRLFSSPRRVGSDYWAQSPSSLSVRATEPITKKKAHFDVLREDFLVELVD